VAGTRVYVGSFDKHLYVLDLASGKQIQKLPLGGSIIASPAIGGGCLVIGNDKGIVHCLGAAKEAGR
jgi:outer membrane protein assembly factor BamB